MAQRTPDLANRRLRAAPTLGICCVLAAVGCTDAPPPEIQNDEAMQRALRQGVPIEASARANYLPRPEYVEVKDENGQPVKNEKGEAVKEAQYHDYFKGMDSITSTKVVFPLLDMGPESNPKDPTKEPFPIELPDLKGEEVLGRNTWMIWCAGNEGFWDWLANESLGFIDLLQLVDTRKRNQRFADGGLINEPGMDQAAEPAPGEFGLWLDLPQDTALRKWRQAYVKQTFEALRAGLHKSQVGLKKGGSSRYGREVDLYRGSPDSIKATYYDYPSSYLPRIEGYSEPGAYGDLDKEVPPPDIYGLSSGVVGLRLFPNPYFDEEAQKKWDAKRFYTDKSYSSDPYLVRPYRVGVSCAYCHASFHPLKPPSDVNHPEWTSISGSIGAQYLRIRVAFGNLLTPDNFVYHLLDSQPPGTIDTSLVASDNINNPNTMNAVFKLKERVLVSLHNPREVLSATSAEQPSLWKNPEPDPPEKADAPSPALRKELEALGLGQELTDSNKNPRRVPRILLDGSDGVGAWIALARVYLNIGSYWEQWNVIHQPVLGFTPQRPFRINDCESHSVYWNATELRVPGLRDYFLKVTPAMPLLATPGGLERIKPLEKAEAGAVAEPPTEKTERLAREVRERGRRIDVTKLARGRQVFAKNCIVCHSSIQPESSAYALHPGVDEAAAMARKEYSHAHAELIQRRLRVRNADATEEEFWEHDPGQWLRHPGYQAWALEIVEKPEFWTSNYLSTDYRIPVTLVGTNSSRALATNAMSGHMWEDFASESYRKLPSPGTISYFNPYAGPEGAVETFTPRHIAPTGAPPGGGGPGFYRVPTLVSIWATAPLLHNNSLGTFNNDPSVNGRLDAFDDAIRKLLWPEKRLESSSYNGATPERLKKDRGLIWRTTEECVLRLDSKRVPYFAKRVPFVSTLYERYDWLETINPLWLPSAIFFFGSLLILLASNSQRRRYWAYVVLAGVIVFWLALLLADRYPEASWLDCLRTIQPRWLPLGALFGLVAVLLLPWSAFWRRFVAYASVIAAVLIGGIVYFNAGRLGDVALGPIPKGTPVNLIANFSSEADRGQQVKSVKQTLAGLAEIRSRHLSPEDAEQVLKTKVAPALLAVNKCPDFVMDRGHYFEWFKTMTDDDKNSLIELLKTF